MKTPTFNSTLFQQTLRMHLAKTRLDDCANQTGISMGTLSRLCHGHKPSLQVLLILCGWMDVAPDVFIVFDEKQEPCAQCAIKQHRLDAIAKIAQG